MRKTSDMSEKGNEHASLDELESPSHPDELTPGRGGPHVLTFFHTTTFRAILGWSSLHKERSSVHP